MDVIAFTVLAIVVLVLAWIIATGGGPPSGNPPDTGFSA